MLADATSRIRPALAVLFGLVLTLGSACGGSSTTGGSEPDLPDLVLDVIPDSDGLNVPDLPKDTGGGSDLDAVDMDMDTVDDDLELVCDPGAGGFMCPCVGNGDCLSGYCVLHQGEQVCTIPCQQDCAAGWSCKQAGTTDTTYICLSNHAHLCLPCDKKEDCQEAGSVSTEVCVAYGPAEGSFCGGACEVDGDCPDGYGCMDATTVEGMDTRRCKPLSGECACSELAIEGLMTTSCSHSNEWGTCTGTRVCALDGLTACSAAIPAEEICFNELDDDCDGLTDLDDEDCVIPCVCGDDLCEPDRCGEYWDEEQKTCSVDCAECGNQTCDPGEGPVDCPEDCCGGCGDGHCRGGACGEDPLTCPEDCGHWACGDGDCDPGESSVECPVDCQPFACGNHSCEPLEDSASCPDDCGAACGDCQCTPPESFVTCPVDCGFCGDGYCSPCSHLGETKEDCAPDCCTPLCVGKECGDDGCGGLCGLCPADDLCRSACDAGTCGPGHDEEEACDGLDEDCDGQTDEGFTWADPGSGEAKGLGDACGAGVCSGGVLLCSADGEGLICSSDVEAGGERCDGDDNDCDGLTDGEDAFDLMGGDPRPCEQTLGVCAGARKPASLCEAGAWLPCDEATYVAQAMTYEAGREVSCDGLDNDCDGETDEDLSVALLSGELAWGVGAACGVGLCAGGVTLCREDGLGVACPNEVFARLEHCDGKDEDCDGVTDEDEAPSVTKCGVGACAAIGQLVCQGGSEVDTCVPLSPPPSETDTSCDGLDEDCDGAIDEDYAPSETACGIGACTATGQLVCQEGSEVDTCVPDEGAASDEVCDSIDNDCDGLSDAEDTDDIDQAGLFLSDLPLCPEQRGVCQGSITPAARCVVGAWQACEVEDYQVHFVGYAADGSDAVCDGLDNDCDGETDEDYVPSDTSS